MKKLLKIMAEDAPLDIAKLAKLSGMGEKEIVALLKKYQKENLYHGCTAIFDDRIFGTDQVRALIEVRITPRREGGFDQVARRIAKFPEVTDLFLVSGSYDLLLTVQGKSLNEVANFVAAKLATIDGVLSTSTSFQLKKYKEAGHVMQEDEDYERLKICP
ncbi:MAG: Lrp/AsnC family transcriptional regulator [Victivallaceae bacterium]|nr:Lrp/AsnC family transcriptional regulator [Victivallaceae bacterium]